MKTTGPVADSEKSLARREVKNMAVNRYEQQPRFIQSPVVIEAGSQIVPCAGKNEIYSLGLTPYQDHGRPAYFGSTIKSNRTITEAAKDLDPEEAERLNEAMETQLDRLLEKKPLGSAAVLTSSVEGKPDVSVVIVGNPWNESSLRLYCHTGEHNGAPILWVDGRTTRKEAEKVERAFKLDGKYKPPKKWNLRKGRS